MFFIFCCELMRIAVSLMEFTVIMTFSVGLVTFFVRPEYCASLSLNIRKNGTFLTFPLFLSA